MTLEEAIAHLDESLKDKSHEWSCEECRKEHEQLRDWLKELRRRREIRTKVSKVEDSFGAESLFMKLYPEYCCRGKPMHPYIDVFETGVEYAFNDIEVMIEEEER